MARAVASWFSDTSIPTGRAPRRASHADTYAVPHPSSTTSLPSTSGSAPTSASGTPQMPQLIVSVAHWRSASATSSTALTFQASRLTRACSGSSMA